MQHFMVSDRTEPGETMTGEFLYSDVCKAGSSENCSSIIPSDREYLSGIPNSHPEFALSFYLIAFN